MGVDTWISNTWSCFPRVSCCNSWLWTVRHRNRSRVFYRVARVINNTLQRICFPDCCLINFLSYRINYCILKCCLALQSTSRIRLSSKAIRWINRFNCISRLVTYRIRPLWLFLGCIPYITKSWSSNSSCFLWACPI